MISFEEAERIVMAAARRLSDETVPLNTALGRVLAEDVKADMAMPPYHKAIVDGYTCRRADLGGPLALVETVVAGYAPKEAIGPGQCAKIMTGAMVPEGADCVFMVELSEAGDDGVRFIGERTDDNIVPMGTDVEVGDVLLDAGHCVGACDIAVLASMGYARPKVSTRPRVGVIATGDELVEPEVKPDVSQIRNSNAYQLCAQAEAMGARAMYVGTARDTEESLNEHLQQAVAENDVVLFSGGVSMGDFDLVPGALTANGISIQFDKVAVQPGKPTVFAHSDTVFCFGLPGNPVSSYVMFELLVKPFLFKLMGRAFRPQTVRMPLAATIRRKSGARKAWVPISVTTEGTVARIEYHGSAHINALSHADGLIAFPIDVTEIEQGTVVPVRIIRL